MWNEKDASLLNYTKEIQMPPKYARERDIKWTENNRPAFPPTPLLEIRMEIKMEVNVVKQEKKVFISTKNERSKDGES